MKKKTLDFKGIILPAKYVPKKSEPYMCPEHLAFFYNMLTKQRDELLNNTNSILDDVRTAEKNDTAGVGDEQDQASIEQELTMNLRVSERNDNLLAKINSAIERIDNGSFGYSIISGDEIGLQRLIARPLATMTVEEQEEYEQKK